VSVYGGYAGTAGRLSARSLADRAEPPRLHARIAACTAQLL